MEMKVCFTMTPMGVAPRKICKKENKIRRQAKAHVQFCGEGAEGKFLVTLFNRYNFRVGKRPIKGREYLEEGLLDF